ncbi:cytochrome p450 3a13 [Plakobranchus ocellatus]|uniref:Cytochrome p450 3a13 n=1 Tax=Plakobranchus ocellatus TaxID=259542 RepID=A0AAV4B9M6_9GAST|nr:cytochrome p450 3a13 [Plakobranchus ocellatus]
MVTLVDFLGLSFWTMLLLVLVITLVYIYSCTWCGLWKRLGYPEGPRCLPFLGSMIDLFDPKKGTIACVAEWQKKYGRVIPCFWFWDPMLVITDPKIIREITVKNFNTWSDRYMQGHGDLQQRILCKGLFFAEDADWKRVRRIMTPTFSGKKLKMLTHYMNLTSHRLAEKISICALEAQPAYAKNMFGAFALDVLCGTAFGLDINSQNDSSESFLKHAQSLMTFDKYVQMRLTLAGLFPFMTKVFKMLNMGFFLYRDIGFF